MLSSLKQDALLGRVFRNSAHLLSRNSLSLGLSFGLGILSARLLGAAEFGLLAVVMGYASTVNSLLSFRMSELVVRYGGEYLERGEHEKAAALIKAAALAEALVSMLAFLAVVLTAGPAARYIARTPEAAWMFGVFALGLLANFNYETAIGVLQITDRIRRQGTINLIQSSVSFLIVAGAFVWGGDLRFVLTAYLLGKTILGLGTFISAQVQLRRALGPGWWRAGFGVLSNYREQARFAVSSNVSGTLIKIFRESEIVWVGLLLTTTAAGYYKAAYSLVGLLAVVADPLISTVYPEINRLIVQQAWPRLRAFLSRVTALAFAFNLLQALGFILLGRWMLSLYGPDYTAGYPALLALLAGLAFNYTFFWNRPLLLALGRPGFPIQTTLVVGLVKLGLAFLLVPRFGLVAAGALLSFYYIASVGVMAWRGVMEIKYREINREDAKVVKVDG